MSAGGHAGSEFRGPPPVCQEAAAHVARAVAPRGGAGHAVCLPRLPRELRAVHVPVLLPLGRQGAA